MKRPLPSRTVASTVYASNSPVRLNALSPTLPRKSDWPVVEGRGPMRRRRASAVRVHRSRRHLSRRLGSSRPAARSPVRGRTRGSTSVKRSRSVRPARTDLSGGELRAIPSDEASRAVEPRRPRRLWYPPRAWDSRSRWSDRSAAAHRRARVTTCRRDRPWPADRPGRRSSVSPARTADCGRIGDLDLLVRAEIAEVKHRLGVGHRGVGEAEPVRGPLAVGGEQGVVDRAPPGVVIDRENLLARGRGACATSGAAGEHNEHSDERQPVASGRIKKEVGREDGGQNSQISRASARPAEGIAVWSRSPVSSSHP